MKVLSVICLGLLVAGASASPTKLHLNPFLMPFNLENQCGDQTAGGLGPAMRKFVDLMPFEEMIDIFFDAVIEDPDVTDFFNYLTGAEFGTLAEAVRNMPEFVDFMEYICIELKFDFYRWLNALGEILGIPPVTRPPGAPIVRSASYNQGGVKRLIDQLNAMIPRADIKAMWLEQIETDPYLCQAFRKLSSTEFKAIATKVEFHPEFLRFKLKLREQGADPDTFFNSFKRFIWETNYCPL